MELLNIIFTKDRPKVLFACLGSLEECTRVKIDKTIIFDDNSNGNTVNFLYNHSAERGWDLSLKRSSEGYARNYFDAYQAIKKYNYDVVSIIESDYVFRNNYMEEVLSVFDALPNCWVIKGFCHKEYYNRDKIIPWFKDETTKEFGSPLKSADVLYNPFDLETSEGKIQCMYGSHACGTIFINWKRIKEFVDIEKELDPIILKACKNNEYNMVINDGLISSGLAKLWDDKVNKDGDKNHSSGVVLISDYSLAAHLNSGGINNDGLQEEGETSVTVNFPQDYKNFKR